MGAGLGNITIKHAWLHRSSTAMEGLDPDIHFHQTFVANVGLPDCHSGVLNSFDF